MSDITEAANQVTVCNILKQRTRFFLLNQPIPRYTPVSPYPQYTKFQLDMRRKAEILQYKKNSTQGMQQTKTQKYSQIMNSNRYSNSKTICTEDLLKPQSTTSSDVPGPPMILYYDPKIPLYNYQTNQDPYAIENAPIKRWQDTISSNLLSLSNNIQSNYQGGVNGITNIITSETLFMTLSIYNIESLYNYRLGLPIGFYISGINTNNTDISANFVLNKASLNVYFYPQTPVVFSADSSNNYILVNNHSISTSSDISGSIYINPSSTFYGNQYIGNLDVSNIILPSQYGNVYDFKFVFDITINITTPTSSTQGYLSNLQAGISMNTPIVTTTSNCSFKPQPSNITQNYKNYLFTGSPS